MNTSSDYKKPKIVPPIWLSLCLLSIYALDRWLPVKEWDISLAVWLAPILTIIGITLILTATAGFTKAKTGIVPFSESTQLVTGGIYRFTRNPMYLGMTFILAAVATAFGSLSAWIPLPLFILIIQQQFIVNEEIFLTGIYGDEYRDYRRKVRRWL
jgi:protein-S-isoprenylcysteine O-methyltransferase Ste14